MSNDEFTRLFKYLQNELGDINSKLENTATKHQVDNLTGTVDGIAKSMTDYHQEMLMLSNKVERLEKWIHMIADKTGVKLSYE